MPLAEAISLYSRYRVMIRVPYWLHARPRSSCSSIAGDPMVKTVCVCVRMCHSLRGSQKTTCENRFSSSTMWVKLRLSVRQGGKYLYVLSHLIDPRGSIYLFLCLSLLCMCECRDSGSSQRTTLHSRLSPPTLLWAPETELGSLNLHSQHVLYPLPEAEPSSSHPWRCYRRVTILAVDNR